RTARESPRLPNRLAHLEHAFDRAKRLQTDLLGHGDLRLLVDEGKVQLFDRVEPHVRALVAAAPVLWRGRDERLPRIVLLHLMEDTLLGRDDERVLFALPGEPADRTRRADEVCVPQNGLLTFRVSQNWRIRVTNLQPDELLLAEDLVYDARAVPEHHVPPGLLRKEAAEVAI